MELTLQAYKRLQLPFVACGKIYVIDFKTHFTLVLQMLSFECLLNTKFMT